MKPIIGATLSEPHIDGTAGRFHYYYHYSTAVTCAPRLVARCRASVTARGSRYTAQKVLYCQTVCQTVCHCFVVSTWSHCQEIQ